MNTRQFNFVLILLILTLASASFASEAVYMKDKSVDELIEYLADDNPTNRERAAKQLGGLGRLAVDAVPVLIEALWDDNLQVVRAVTETLVKIGPEKGVVDALIGLMHEGEGYYRRAAIHALGGLEDSASDAVPYLIDFLDHDKYSSYLISDVARALGSIGPEAADAIPHLINLFDGYSSSVSSEATNALRMIGPESIPALMETLETGSKSQREHSARTLGGFDPPAMEAFPLLMDTFMEDDIDVAIAAASALVSMNPDSEVIDALIYALKYEDHKLSQAAAEKLADIGPEPGVVDALVSVLADGDPSIQLAAIRALGKIGPQTGVLDALIVVSGDETSYVQAAAIIAIGQMGNLPGVIDILINALGDAEENVRDAAAKALRGFGPDAKDAVPALIPLVENGSWEVLHTLLAIGPDASDAIPAIIQKIENNPAYFNAIRTLGIVGKGSVAAGKALANLLLTCDDANSQKYALKACQAVGATVDTVDALIEFAKNETDIELRRHALHVLAFYGPDAQAAVPGLIELIDDENSPVRDMAEYMLEKILPGMAGDDVCIDEYIQYFADGLYSEDIVIRQSARSTMKAFGEKGVPFLLEALESDEIEISMDAAYTLMGHDVYGPQAIEAFNEALEAGENWELLEMMVHTLGVYAYNDRSLVPILITAMHHDRLGPKHEAIRALYRIGPEPGVVDALIDELNGCFVRDSVVACRFIFSTFEEFGPDAIDAVPALLDIISNAKPEYQVQAIHVLESIKPDADIVIPALREALNDDDSHVRIAASRMIWEFSRSTEGLPILIEGLTDVNDDARIEAAKGICGMGPDTKDAIPELIDALYDRNHDVRWYSVIALGKMGADAEDALPLLRNIIETGYARDIPQTGYAGLESPPVKESGDGESAEDAKPTIKDKALEAIAKIEAAIENEND